MTGRKYIGTNFLRKEDRRFLKGAGKFVADVHLSNMVHAAVFRSQEAHAQIREIRTERAKALPEVLGVFTSQDFETLGRIPMRLAPREALRECFQTPIARNCVRYVGEPLALVVALDRYTAEDALELIEADFDRLPIIADATQGRQNDVAHIHPSLGSNIAERIVMRFGDPERVLDEAPVRVRETFRIQRHTGTPIETRGLIASFDAGTEMVTVWGAAKVPHFNRQILAGLLDRPENSIHSTLR